MTSEISDFLTALREYAILNRVPVISRGGEDVLISLVKKHQPVSILEIGTAIGYSSILMAAYQPPGSKFITIEKNPEMIEKSKEFFKAAGSRVRVSIEVIEGDAGVVIPRLDGFFDLVFIDAAKGQYLDYLFKVMPKLTSNAVIAADNVLFRGWTLQQGGSATQVPKRYRTIVKRLNAYLDFVCSDPRFKTFIHRIGDGIAVSYYDKP